MEFAKRMSYFGEGVFATLMKMKQDKIVVIFRSVDMVVCEEIE